MDRGGILNPRNWIRPSRRRVVIALVTAANERRYADFARLLADDVRYLDSKNVPVHGIDDLLESMRVLHRQVPDTQIEIAEEIVSGGDILLRGRLLSSNPEFISDSLWRVKFDGAKISEIQAFRSDNILSLADVLKRARRDNM